METMELMLLPKHEKRAAAAAQTMQQLTFKRT
jgi:hypothetical protein